MACFPSSPEVALRYHWYPCVPGPGVEVPALLYVIPAVSVEPHINWPVMVGPVATGRSAAWATVTVRADEASTPVSGLPVDDRGITRTLICRRTWLGPRNSVLLALGAAQEIGVAFPGSCSHHWYV